MEMEYAQSGEGSSQVKQKKERTRRSQEPAFKRPEGMHRELYALLAGDNKEPPPIILSDVMPGLPGGYKQIKAKLGLKKARNWIWTPFVNPGRKDGFQLHHWRRAVDAAKDYPFAKFNRTVTVASYTDQEYTQFLSSDSWTKDETDHLFDLCRRFDLRFIVIYDKWDREKFTTKRSVEDLKERYYSACNLLKRTKATPQEGVQKLKMFDANHERKRKEQLIKLYNRTTEQVEEEQTLLEELRKIEQRKKEREKKTQDLQKLITAADANTSHISHHNPGHSRKSHDSIQSSSQKSVQRAQGRKKVPSSSTQRSSGSKESSSATSVNANLMEAGIKFPENKTSGPSLRSRRMRLPPSVGQKKTKAIEQLLQELNIDLKPIPSEEICHEFNELRSDMVLLYELKTALANCEFELQTLKHQYEASTTTTTTTTAKNN